MRDYDRVIELSPGFPEAYYQRGHLNLKMKRYAAAVVDYSTAVELSPEIALKPEKAYFMNALARVLATCPLDDVRNGGRSIEIAEKLNAYAEASLDKVDGAASIARYKDTLAASLAEAGRFDEAVRVQKEAIGYMEKTSEEEEIKREFEKRLEWYRAGRPWREEWQSKQ